MSSEQPREGEARVDWPAKPQRDECVVGDSVWWSHDWNGNGTRCFRCGYKPALPSEQPPTRVHECPTCGSPVEVVSSDEGTHHYRPAPSEQPREGTRVEWRCSHCKEPVSGPNEFCGGKFGDKDHPPMARPERVSLEPASPTPTEQENDR